MINVKISSNFILFCAVFLAMSTFSAPTISFGMGKSQIAEEQQNLPFVGDIKVHRYLFKNGLRLLVIEDKTSPTFAYQTWFNVGSRDERPGKTGLAHLFEHMMFKETKNLKEGEFDKKLEEAGVEGKNAFTSFDYTAYISELPVEKFELIVQLESERLKNLVINEKGYRAELEVVKNERKFRVDNSPDGMLFENLFGTAFKSHPYKWPIIGYQKDLEGMTSADARDFYARYYNPSNAVIAVVGALKPGKVADVIDKYFGKIPGRPVQALAPIEPEAKQKRIRRKKLNLNIKLEKLYMAYHVPSIKHEDAPKFEVLQAILTSGKSARLNRSLVNTGIATSVDSGSFQFKDPSLFMISTDLQKGKKSAIAEDIILRELFKISKSPITTKEFERAMNQIDFVFINGLNSNASKANFLGRYETIFGDYKKGLDFQKKISMVSIQDVKGLIPKYFKPNQRTIIRGVPKR